MLIGWSFAATGSPNAFFYGAGGVLPVQHRHQLVVLRPERGGETVLMSSPLSQQGITPALLGDSLAA
jgi:hypothetical protein